MKAVYNKAPSFSFGSRHKDLRTKALENNPAANAYDVPPTLKTTAGPKIGMKINPLKRSQTPGPGKYNLSSSYQNVVKKRPSYSMGARLSKAARKQFIPGPGSYNLHKSTSCYRATPKFTMRPRCNMRTRGGCAETPGAKYNISGTIGTGLKKTMFGRTFPPVKKTSSTPGPNAYSPNKLKVQTARPQFTMRARTAGPKPGNTANPGPKYLIQSQFGQ